MSLQAFDILGFQNNAFQISKWYDVGTSVGGTWSLVVAGSGNIWTAINTGTSTWVPVDTSN